MAFIQIVEFKTSKIDEMRAASEKYRGDTEGKRSTGPVTLTENRDKPGTYMVVAEFPSYEEAMKNSELPETQALSQEMMKLGDGPPTFYNLDVVETWQD